MNKDIELTIKILDSNARVLSMRLLERLTELKLPFIVDNNNYPVMLNDKDKKKSEKIYEEICIDFLNNYKLTVL